MCLISVDTHLQILNTSKYFKFRMTGKDTTRGSTSGVLLGSDGRGLGQGPEVVFPQHSLLVTWVPLLLCDLGILLPGLSMGAVLALAPRGTAWSP